MLRPRVHPAKMFPIGNILCLCIKITNYKYEADNEKTVCGQVGRMDWERTDNSTYRSKKSG